MQTIKKNISISSKFRALGTDVFLEIVLGDHEEKKKAIDDLNQAKSIFFNLEKVFSRFDPKSELSKLNEKLGVWQKASTDMTYLGLRALYYNKISGGLYDPRVIEILEKIGYEKDFKKNDFERIKRSGKMDRIEKKLKADLKIKNDQVFFSRRMDFSGIAKGYIVDRAAEFLKSRGWEDFLVDAGGDMNISGKNKEGESWKISVEGIASKKLLLALSNRGVATSGISRKKWEIAGKKFHHLVNPKNPSYFSYELKTVSVVAENTENADGRAKTLVLMGKKKGLAFSKDNNIPAIFLDYKGDIFISPEAMKYIIGKISDI
jgi:thiamine biosynthesis lipoprotein